MCLLNEFLLGGVLDGAGVYQAGISIVHFVDDLVTILGKEPCHVLTITDVVGAAIGFHEYLLLSWQAVAIPIAAAFFFIICFFVALGGINRFLFRGRRFTFWLSLFLGRRCLSYDLAL